MIKILINVEGGIVQSVTTTDPNMSIGIVDYDKHSDEPVLASVHEPDLVVSNMREAFTDPLSKDEKFAVKEFKKKGFFK